MLNNARKFVAAVVHALAVNAEAKENNFNIAVEANGFNLLDASRLIQRALKGTGYDFVNVGTESGPIHAGTVYTVYGVAAA